MPGGVGGRREQFRLLPDAKVNINRKWRWARVHPYLREYAPPRRVIRRPQQKVGAISALARILLGIYGLVSCLINTLCIQGES